MSDKVHFKLPTRFVAQYAKKQVPWGFGVLSELVYYRTFSRIKPDGANEKWFETVRRVVEGTYSMQKRWILSQSLGWNEDRAQKSAAEMYDRMFHMKFLPPGRGLWAMGSAITEERGLYAALNNCAFVSTHDENDVAAPYCFLMDMSMLGVGVGFDTKGGDVRVHGPRGDYALYTIPDTREGWVHSVRLILESYLLRRDKVAFDYSLIRDAGEPIKGFGGIASGPVPLIELHSRLVGVLESRVGGALGARGVADIMNMIGACVVAGNVRRTAEICFGDPMDEEFLDLKNYTRNPDRANYGWTSNNSIFATVGMDYSAVAERTRLNGEPGYEWLNNARAYGRMAEAPDWKDYRASGGNPCTKSDAPLLTPLGIRKLGDVNIGDIIWSGGRWTKVVNKWCTGVKPVYKYTTRAGYFEGTETHRILQNGEKIEVGQADSIDIATGLAAIGYELDPQDIMDGIVFGDGTAGGRGKPVRLCVGSRDADYFESEIGGLLGSRYDGQEYRVTTTITHEELPKTYERRIPDRFKYGEPYKVLGFLRGLYSANGSICGGRITLKASSLRVIEDVQIMLSSIGISSYYTVNKPHDVEFRNGTYTCRESYDLNITTDKGLFTRLIGFVQGYKQDAAGELKPGSRHKTSYEIVSKEYLGDFEVYDITVDCPEHTYWCGGLLVSNCLEQTLENYELCCLVETFPDKHEHLEDYIRTLKFAYLYAKTVTLGSTHWTGTNRVMQRNRRIGTSMTGIAQFIARRGVNTLKNWCERGYGAIQGFDETYSNWFGIPRSIKTTSVKPSGTVSILAGATPGVHYPEARQYIRRVRLSVHSPLVQPLKDAGYVVEPAFGSEASTVVVEIPVNVGEVRTAAEVSIWEQMELAAFLQSYWADNQVSVTVTFDPETEGHQIERCLDFYQYRLKGVSFLPRIDYGAFPQMPYEAISASRYAEIVAGLKPLNLSVVGEEAEPDMYCDSEGCSVI